VALAAAVLGLSVATAAAVADPTDEATPPATETSETAPPAETPTETAPPTDSTEPSTDPSTPPPSSSTAEQPTGEKPAEEPADDDPAKEKEDDAPSVQSIRDLQMTATFDKSSYNVGEKMSISVTVKNAGTDSLTVQADFFSINPDSINVEYPDPFDVVTLAPGASVTHTVKGSFGNPAVTTAKLYAWWYPPGGGEAKAFDFSVPIKQTTGHVSGTVYTDRNNNGKFDAGEGQSGVTLAFSNNVYYEHRPTTTTNATGQFSVDLPTVSYYVSGTGPNGLEVGGRAITVTQSGLDNLVFRAVGAITGLSVDLEFLKDTYARDEAPVVRVTLTNDGDVPLYGLVASCNRAGFSNELIGVGEGWGDLAYGTDGVTVAAHSTKVIEVSEPMPAGAYDYGYVVVACDFGYEGTTPDQSASDFDIADVPGQRGDLGGVVVDDDTGTGNGVAGVRLVLVPEDGDCPAAEDVTDAEGKFAFEQVPVGNYDLYVFPPAGWHYLYENPTSTSVVGSYPGQTYLVLAPGDAAAPTLPNCPTPATPAAPPAPAPQARTAPASLPDTGASIVVPGIIGLLAVLTGAGAVVMTRRRKNV
jgi:LPXTG-motif cell wall-anchored protein